MCERQVLSQLYSFHPWYSYRILHQMGFVESSGNLAYNVLCFHSFLKFAIVNLKVLSKLGWVF